MCYDLENFVTCDVGDKFSQTKYSNSSCKTCVASLRAIASEQPSLEMDARVSPLCVSEENFKLPHQEVAGLATL